MSFNSVDYVDERAQARANIGAVDLRDPKNKDVLPSYMDWNRWGCRDYGPLPKDFRRTIQTDPRYPNQNVTKWCWMLYIDYHRCLRKYGQGYKDCDYYKWGYNEVCPTEWVEKFDEQRENGIFACEHMIKRQKKLK